MSAKRSVGALSIANAKRRKSGDHLSYFQRTLQECKLILKNPPEKCEATQDIVYIVRDLKKNLKEHHDYPLNVEKFISEFESACSDEETFKHYLFLNIVKKTNETTSNIDDSVIKILLNVTFLQTKIIQYIFDRAFDVLNNTNFGPWVKMILKSFSNLNTIECSELLSSKLIDLLDVSSDETVRLEIISAIPDIIGDREHDNVASEMSRIMSNESDARKLIPSILDCLTYLCLSDSQFECLQKETLNLMQPSNAAYFSIFVKFLLTPGRLTDSAYEETVKGLRNKLGWSSLIGLKNDIPTSQILTAKEIRNSMLSSKAISKAWIKVISGCTSCNEHKPIDIIIFVIIASLSDEKQKQIENVMRKQIKLGILKEDLLDKAVNLFKPILNEYMYIMTMISLANSLLKPGIEPSVESFGSHMHMVMFSELTECRPVIINELLQLVLNCKKSALNTLNILNNIASENMSVMKPQSNQMLILLDRLDDMTLTEIRAIMNLVCGLAYSSDSAIRDELHMTIIKQLGSSIPSIKIQGILAGIHAVKYLMMCTTNEDEELQEYITLNMTSLLPDGDLREAAKIIEIIHHSTAQFPDIIAFFYDELYKIIYQAKIINKSFLIWLTNALSNYWQENFLINVIQKDTFGEIKLSMQLRLNLDSEIDEEWAVNIGGLVFEDNKEINVEVLSPLFQLVRVLLHKKTNGDLSDIDALLGCPIVMPIIDVDLINDLSDLSVKKVLDCYSICANWIRELLNAFISQEDAELKPKILNRIAQLRDLEKSINKLTDKGKKLEQDDTVLVGSIRTQQTQITQISKTRTTTSNKHFRPLDLTLLRLLQYDLTPLNASETELTFEILTYLLSYINNGLEKILVPRIKKKTFLNKNALEIYSYSEAETQANAVNNIIPKLIDHINLIISFLDCHIIEDGCIDLETFNTLNIMESLWCLEQIYNLLTIYFKWIEFRNGGVSLLKTSLQTLAKVNDDKLLLEDLVTAVARIFQKHEKYIKMISSAASLMQFMKALQELSPRSNVPSILKDMAHKFLSKQWKNLNDQLEKGIFYNQYLDTLTKVYLENNTIADLKGIISSLVDDVGNLRDKTSVLTSLKSINKSNFSILFKNVGAALCDKIKSNLNGGLTNEEHVEMWGTVANILKLMSNMVATLDNKHTASHFLKKSIPILNIFLSKGFPILNIEFQDNRQSILDVLKDFQTSTECLRNICSQSSDSVLMQKIPCMQELLTSFIYKTKDLLIANDCSEALKMFIVKDVPESRRKSKKTAQKPVQADVTLEDLDDDLPPDESDASNEICNIDSVGISEVI